MKKLRVVDFLFETFNITSDEFCCSLAIFYTFENTNIEELEIDDLTYFSITIGTPKGIGSYFEKIRDNSINIISYFPHIAVVDTFDKESLKAIIKEKLETIVGKNENEVIKKAMIFFDWQYQDDEYELNKL
ncbi:hypothetical protein D3H65_24450 [Paraflavitalea soli]|uniref:Uncharacterized protein n=1 Tax=Paraflavitalea soli TaxID=2315862 RepID=A0A3B7MYX3_9BACT|nr:Imm8 family immunity protein [Paraflavitalea soli]AXY76945.1 hypothetical protein D3H65_24450 [Paraflavitalea soli]